MKVRIAKRAGAGFFGLFALTFIFSYYIFFFGCYVFGVQIQSGDLTRYSIALFVVVMLYYLGSLIRLRRFRVSEVIIVICLVLLLAGIALSYITHGFMAKTTQDTLLDFGVRAAPSVLLGVYTAKRGRLSELLFSLDLFILLCTVGIGLMTITSLISGNGLSYLATLGMDYQGVSYFASYVLGLDLYVLFYGSHRPSFRFMSGSAGPVLRLICAGVLLFSVIYSGGRGGFVVVVVLLLYLLADMLFLKREKASLPRRVVLIIASVASICSIILFVPSVSQGFARIIQFIGPDGINWSGTSGRDVVYSTALSVIEQSPIVGHGIASGEYYGMTQCHNLFLDLLLEGGVIYLLIWVGVLLIFAKKLYKKIRANSAYHFIAILFLCEFTNLMFSSIYLRESMIWFSMAFVFTEGKSLISEPPDERGYKSALTQNPASREK